MTRDETQALGYAIAILRDRLDVEASHNAAIIRGYINTLAALRSRPAPPDDPQLGGHQCINVALDAANFCALRGDPLHAVGIRILVERYQKLAAPVAAPDDLERKHRVPDDVMMLARAGKLIDAIKLLRHDFELPLKEAKLLVEDAMRIEAIRATAAALAAPAPVAALAPETPAPVDVPACPDGQHSYRRNAPPQNGDVCFVCRKSIWWETPAPDAMPEIQVGDRIGWRHRQTGEVFDTPERRHRVGVPQAWPHGGDEVCELLSIERNGVVIWRRQEAQP